MAALGDRLRLAESGHWKVYFLRELSLALSDKPSFRLFWWSFLKEYLRLCPGGLAVSRSSSALKSVDGCIVGNCTPLDQMSASHLTSRLYRI